jgi:hypothetical protein
MDSRARPSAPPMSNWADQQDHTTCDRHPAGYDPKGSLLDMAERNVPGISSGEVRGGGCIPQEYPKKAEDRSQSAPANACRISLAHLVAAPHEPRLFGVITGPGPPAPSPWVIISRAFLARVCEPPEKLGQSIRRQRMSQIPGMPAPSWANVDDSETIVV